MTRPLAEVLAVLPSGRQMRALSKEELEGYLRQNYLKSEVEKARRQRHLKRQELYQDGGIRYIDELIDQVFEKPEIRQRRKIWAKVARFNNVLKRIVNEMSTVYQRPATRSLKEKTATDRYRELQRMIRQDERMRQVNKLLNLHRSLFVGFRVRAADNAPVIDIITPDRCFAVTHPNDASVVVALILDVSYKTAVHQRNAPAYLVWTDHERFQMTKDGVIIESSSVEHKIGVMPFVHVSLEPAIDGFWPGEAGEDLVAATMAVWFANTSLLKETKSASKFPVVQGDMTTAARDQAADADEVVELPEGAALSAVDTSMDLDLFLKTSDHVIENVGSNYGLSLAQLKHQGVQSAEARELMRAPLMELREEQMVPLAAFERAFFALQVAVLQRDRPDLAFAEAAAAGWVIRFGEVKTVLDAKSKLEVFEQKRRLGLTNTLEFLMDEHDLTEDQALDVLEENVSVELARNVLMRPLQEVNGSTNQPSDATASTAQQNGALGPAAKQETPPS